MLNFDDFRSALLGMTSKDWSRDDSFIVRRDALTRDDIESEHAEMQREMFASAYHATGSTAQAMDEVNESRLRRW